MVSVVGGKPEDENAFLEALGRRVRERREEAHLTRKRLAELSGLSERYLAQLEAGDGNISILLIRRVAEALACPIEQLIGDRSFDPEIVAALDGDAFLPLALGRADYWPALATAHLSKR